MGEAKRRREKGNLSWTDNRDPRVLAIFEEAGEPISLALVGAGLIMPTVTAMPLDELMKPQHRALRLAFGVFDRIRTGEIEGRCGLCSTRYNVQGFSCYAVIERARGTSRKKPALTLPICHSCDSVSTQETQRRVLEMFPMAGISKGGTA
jgi:hypothetical protein